MPRFPLQIIVWTWNPTPNGFVLSCLPHLPYDAQIVLMLEIIFPIPLFLSQVLAGPA